MKAKRLLILLIILLLPVGNALANSGPTSSSGYPAADLFAVDENSPVEVWSENLTFDFSRHEERPDYGLWGVVTADYEMHNPTDEELRVGMAFPVISVLSEPLDTLVTIDKCVSDYGISYGGIFPMQAAELSDTQADFLSFGSVVEKLNYDVSQSKYANATGWKYTIRNNGLQPDEGTGMGSFDMSVTYDEKSTTLLNGVESAIHGRSNEGSNENLAHMQLTLGLNIGDETSFYVIGEDLLSLEFDKDYSEDVISYEKEEIALEQALKDIAGHDIDFEDYWWEEILYPAYLQYFEDNNKDIFMMDIELQSLIHQYSMTVITYDVVFQPGQTRMVSVESNIMSYMSESGNAQTVYYLTNPAQYWANFGYLHAGIIPPKGDNYKLRSNYDWQLVEPSGIYLANFDGLPDGDLTFTFYHPKPLYAQPWIWAVVVVIIAAFAALLIHFRKRGRGKGKNAAGR